MVTASTKFTPSTIIIYEQCQGIQDRDLTNFTIWICDILQGQVNTIYCNYTNDVRNGTFNINFI